MTPTARTLAINSSGISISGAVTGDNSATFDGAGTFNGGHTVSQHVHIGEGAGNETQKPTG